MKHATRYFRDWGTVVEGDLAQVHSVLLQPSIDFTIYLPPSEVKA